MEFRKSIFYLVIAPIALISCKKSKGPVPQVNVDVYLAGDIAAANGNTVATYWKNGVATKLADSLVSSQANTIVVNGPDVYVAGTYNSRYAYWKNGVLSTDNDVTTVTTNGNDVYLAGCIVGTNSNLVAAYWKNGVETQLTDVSIASATAESIIVNGGDVYVLASAADVSGNDLLVYWKNGVLTKLTNSDSYQMLHNDLAVSGADVYVSGTNGPSGGLGSFSADYWKNGVAAQFSSNAKESYGYGIALNGNDVYMAGQVITDTEIAAAYWKNGAATILTSDLSAAYAVAVNGNDVYVGGTDAAGAVIWKNGVPTQFGQHKSGSIAAIALVPH